METIKLTIPNMKSHHCQMTVTNVVKEIGGNIVQIAPAHAEIMIESPVSKESVVRAIETAGYKVSSVNE
jgi:copper chaperone CopZ